MTARKRCPYTFQLDSALVERARREVSEHDVIRSIEAALAAAIDYQVWLREIAGEELRAVRGGRAEPKGGTSPGCGARA